MKNSILILLVVGVTMLFAGCSEDNSLTPGSEKSGSVESSLKGTKKPSPTLIGEQYCDFTFTPPTFWNGTVDFGVYGEYGITYISHDAPRGYSQASPFYEDIIIYELGSDWTNPANVRMKGWNAGVVTYANKDPEPVKVVSNGKIEEAYGPLEMWQGCNLHFSGLVFWVDIGIPEGCLGTIRIN